MKCQKCGSEQLHAIDSREAPNGRRRRYKCLDCGARFSTLEVPMDALAEMQKELQLLGDLRRVLQTVIK